MIVFYFLGSVRSLSVLARRPNSSRVLLTPGRDRTREKRVCAEIYIEILSFSSQFKQLLYYSSVYTHIITYEWVHCRCTFSHTGGGGGNNNARLIDHRARAHEKKYIYVRVCPQSSFVTLADLTRPRYRFEFFLRFAPTIFFFYFSSDVLVHECIAQVVPDFNSVCISLCKYTQHTHTHTYV